MSWQTELANAITNLDSLLALLELDSDLLPKTLEAPRFPLRVPKGFVGRMKKRDIHDPLLRQVLPLQQELIATAGYTNDPLLEKNKNPIPGLLHKFQGRVLFITTGACAIHCRYCFRQHFPYKENNPGYKGRADLLNYLAQDTSITEVILSGGDPLVVTDEYLATLVQDLEKIPHIQRLRIHSRIPIVLPERITQGLIDLLSKSRLKMVLVVHCNHAQEIDAYVTCAMQKLTQAGVVLLNQAVLLQGVNDKVDSLVELSESLFACGILPYYLFTLDKVEGTAHFDMPEAVAKELHQGMSARLPGYLVPKLAREEPGRPAKVIIG